MSLDHSYGFRVSARFGVFPVSVHSRYFVPSEGGLRKRLQKL